MRTVSALTAAIIGAAAVIAGCGQQHPGGGAVPVPSPSGSPSAVSVACRSAAPVRRASKLTITAADNGRSFCVTRGTRVVVVLKGTPARKWEPIRASSAALRPSANGETMLPAGVTGAAYIAVQPGSAIILSGRPACGPAAPPKHSTPGSGTLECGAILVFRATVTVAR